MKIHLWTKFTSISFCKFWISILQSLEKFVFDLTLKERDEKVVECDQMSFSLRHSRLNSSADFEFKKDSTLILMTCLTSKVHWWRRQTRSKCQSLRHLLSSHHAHQRRSALFIIQFVILSHIVFISYFLLASSKTYGNYYTPRKWIRAQLHLAHEPTRLPKFKILTS